MKWLAIISSILLTLLLTVYMLAFTAFGNGIVKPIIEEKINAELNSSAVIEIFELDMSHFNLKISLTPSNTIEASGDYALFSQAVDATYHLNFQDMSELEFILQRPSHGAFFIKGSAVGDTESMQIKGESNIATSQTTYDLTLEEFHPTRITANIANAQLQDLLALGGERAYANAAIDVNVLLKDANPKHLDGSVTLDVSQGNVDTALMKKAFNLVLPTTKFGVKVVSKLKNDTIKYVAKVQSNLATLNSQGNLILAPLSMNLNYDVDIKELALLRPITNAPLRGPFATEGQVTGNKAALSIKGSSNIAQSDTFYDVTLADFKPSKVLATISDAKLSKLLYLAGEAAYAEAAINLNVKLTNLDPKNLQGTTHLSISEGRVYTKTMKKSYGITLPKTSFHSDLDVVLKGTQLAYTLGLNSNLANINSKGSLESETLASDIHYDINIQELALFKPITGAPLRGPFATKGSISGDKKAMQIKGTSNLASSNTSYYLGLKQMQADKLQASIKNARIEKLIYMAGAEKLASGLLNVKISLDKLDPEDLHGSAKLTISDALFNQKTFKNVYKLNLPKTDFSSSVDVALKGKRIDYNTRFDSSLASLDSKGSLEPKTMAMDLVLNLVIAKLELLKPLTGAPLRGGVILKTTLKGDKKVLEVKGKATLASADANFNAQLENFIPRSLNATIKDMQLSKILYMVSQPHFVDALLNVDIAIADARQGKLDGVITTAITKGKIDTKTVQKAFEFKTMPATTFSAKTVSTLSKHLVDTTVSLDSSLATLKVKRARFNVTQGSLYSDYKAEIPDLDRLFFATERHLKGKATVTGKLTKAKDLDFNAHSKLFGGTIDAILHNDDFSATMKQLNTLGMLHMLIYPEMFDATLNGKLDYNLAKKSGKFNAKLTNGHFTKNQMLDLIKQYGQVDLYVETFLTTLVSTIKQEKIYTNIDMRSNKSSIVGKNIYLNTKTKQLDAHLDVNANNNPIKVHLKGNVSKPNVKVDASKLIERELKKEAGKQINNLIKGLF